MSLTNLIDTDRLLAFGRGTIVPLAGTIGSVSEAMESIDDRVTRLERNNPVLVTIPTAQTTTYTYTRGGCDLELTGLETEYVTASNISAADAGNYTATFVLNDANTTRWADGTVETKSIAWNVLPKEVTVPTLSDTVKTYNGSEQSPTISSYDSNEIAVGGTTAATNASETAYTVTFDLTSTNNYVWSDGTTAGKSETWNINKAEGGLVLDKQSLTLNSAATYGTVMATVTGDGTLSAVSSDSSIASVSVSGNSITVSSVNNATGTATVIVSVGATTNYTAPQDVAVSVSCEFTRIYGVSWDGTSTTAFSRTDGAAAFVDPSPAVGTGSGSSPFDNLLPWSGLEKVEDSAGGILVKIPKYYYKWTQSGTTLKLQVADGPMSGYSVSPAHADRGDGVGERDIVYVGRYHCASTYKSTSGVKPAANLTRAQFRTNIHNLGSEYYQYDFAMYWTIMMLYLVEFADWNSQAKIGYGCGNNSATENMGSTDSMTYHTGTSAASRTTYGHVQYRWIEDLWGNVYDWCDGIYFSSTNVYCIKNPGSFSDTTGGTLVGTRPTSGGYISAWSVPTAAGFEYALYPSAVSGSDSTYICDYCGYDASGVVLLVGGNYYQGQNRGAFCLYGSDAASGENAGIGSRLQKLPSAA